MPAPRNPRSSPIKAPPKTEAPRPQPAPLAAEKTALQNGLTVITCEDHSAPVTSAQVWARTGSIHEGNQMGAGLSHILEHMLFKGTEKRGVAEIARQVEAHGGYINAYTTWERTVYHIDIPSDGGKPGTSSGTEMAIDILADAMMNSTLPPKEYLREQDVILREMAMGRDNPDRQATELFFATAYVTHPCRHPVIGYEEIYQALKREDVMAYYKERYVPDNLVFLVAGDIDPGKARDQIARLMGSWKRKPLPPQYVPDEAVQISQRIAVEESHTAAQQSRIHIGYQTCDFRHPDSAPLEILGMIAGHGLSSRLYQALREQKKLVHEVDAWSYTPAWRGVFGASAITDPDKAETARDAILAEIARFKTDLVTPAELSKALKISLSGHLGSRKTMSGQAGELGSNEILTGDLAYSDKYLVQLQKVTSEEIRRVAQIYFTPERLTTTILHPKGSLKKSAAAVRKPREEPTRKTTLANGLTLLAKEDHRLPFVELRLVMKSGLLFEDAKNNGISQLASKLLLKGTRQRTAEALVREIESVGGSISPYSGANSMGLAVEVMRPDLRLALDILADIILNSTFEDAAIAREKEAQIAEIRQEREQPVKIAMLNARARLFGAHPYGMPNLGAEATVQSLTREQIVAFWRRVAVPSNMVLAIFGDMTTSEAQTEIQNRFGSLPGASVTPPAPQPTHFGRADRVNEQQDKKQGVVVIAYPGIDLKNPDRAGVELMNAALSGMGSRLFLRLRDQLALCYYVGVSEMIGLHPGFIYFYIGTDPGKLAEAEREILAEIEKIRKDGVSAEELDRARKGLLGERKMQKQNLGELALTSALDELYGLGYDYSDKLDAAYGALGARDIQAVAKKYLSQPSVISVVSPDKKR
ncbi:MAG: insulinase family protein [Verrucomicrobia bacterium]|nr:insulinase family protein [Verrucomicrobiota bacterium]